MTWLRTGALLLFCGLTARAELTPQQITAALGGPPGTWSLSGDGAGNWVVSGDGLKLAPVPAGGFAIQAVVSGPGVASLALDHSFGAFQLSVMVDGSRVGNRHEGIGGMQRVEVGAGDHTVRWELQRAAANNGSKALVLRRAMWEPFVPLPLEAGVTGAGVTLTSPTPGTWKGQSAWHRGDGGAAWSGLRTNGGALGGAPAAAPLMAVVNGPGVLGFQFRSRGDGYASFQFDQAAPETVHSGSSPADVWQHRWQVVGEGSHGLQWNANGYITDANIRSTYDFAVDEVRLQPMIPLDEALETPGWNWTTQAGADGRAAGVADPTASGGSLALIQPGYGIRANVPSQRLLKIRSRGTKPRPFFDTWLTELGSKPTPSSTEWVDSLWALEKNAAELVIYGGGWDGEIDRVELVPLPSTLAAALGSAAWPVTSSSDAVWSAVPYAEIGDHGVKLVARRGDGDSWLEMPVQGPAAVEFSWKIVYYSNAATVLVDGRELDLQGSNSAPVRLEIPAGDHTVRWRMKAPKTTDPWPEFGVILGGVRVSALPIGGIAMATLNRQEPVSVPLGWVKSSELGRAGESVLQSPPGDPTQVDNWARPVIRANFKGPGEVSFWWYGRPAGAGGQEVRWRFQSAGGNLIYYDPGTTSGWSRHRVWVPPGEALYEWGANYFYGPNVSAALGEVTFTPSPVITSGEALGAPDLEWKNDSAKPWLPLVLPGEDGNSLVSPKLASGESSSFSTVVKGPGKLSFRWRTVLWGGDVQGMFKINGTNYQSSGTYPNSDLIEIPIRSSSPVTLEWTVAPNSPGYDTQALLGVDHVTWQPTEEFPLAGSLDAPPEVVWSTSPDHPFSGRSDPGAKGGTLAYIGLLPGEESWLEATVDGQGLFDFWIRQIADMDLSYNPWNYWSLTIDGKPVQINGTSWEPRWIVGVGPHKIRLTFRNPEDSGKRWLASAVDEVSWVPIESVPLATAAGLPGLTWETHGGLPAEGVATAGRNGGPAIVIRSDIPEETWVGTVVEGPCELSWNSQLQQPADAARQFLVVDGVEVLPIVRHSWQRMCLSLPAGSHSVRWVSRLDYEPGEWDRQQSVMSWRLDGMMLTPGISPLAEALDFPELFAVVTGDDGGRRLEMADDDAWEPGIGSSLVIFDPEKAGKITTVWGRPDSASGQWRYEGRDARRYLSTTGSGWHTHVAVLLPGNTEMWSDPGWGESDDLQVPWIKSVTFARSEVKEPGAAMDAPVMTTDTWFGIPNPDAVTGQDSAWSLINLPSNPHAASVSLTGPARVSFWWKLTGPGKLAVSLDGGTLPIAPASATWSKVELAIDSGEHVLSLTHLEGTGLGFSTPSEAWLDGLVTTPVEPHSLTEAATRDGSHELTSMGISEVQNPSPWRPVAFRAADGSWMEAARAVGGSSMLHTTVTGPAILRFRGRCFDGSGPALEPEVVGAGEVGQEIYYGGGGGTGTSYYDWVIDLFVFDQVLGNFLSISVGNSNPLRIDLENSGAWRDAAVRIPPGSHEVTFQVQRLEANRSGGTRIAPGNLQGWIDDLRVVTPASHYAEWVAREKLPADLAGKDVDADGDGFSNFLEYSFSTDPCDGRVLPRPLEFTLASDRWQGSYHTLKLPYLPAHTTGVLQSSTDFSEWVDEPFPQLLYQPPLQSGFLLFPGSFPDPELIQQNYPFLKLPADEPRKFYRIGISDPE